MHAVTAVAGTKTLAWDPPATNTDGTPLTDLAGYEIYYGPTPGNYTNTLDVGNVTTSVVNNLTDGSTYYFAVTAYNSAGVESGFSNEVNATPPPPPPQLTVTTFTITATADIGGSITPAGTTGVSSGANQTFTIAPSAGYHVAAVLVDGASMGAVTTYTFTSVTANHTIAASFAINTYTVTASADAGGAISPAGAVSSNYGGNAIFSITPNAGYSTTDVKVDGVSKGAVTTYTFTNISANHTITSSFAANTIAGGAVTPDGSNTVLTLSKTLSLHRYTMTITDTSYDPDCSASGHDGYGKIEVLWDGNNTWTRDTAVDLCSPTNNIYTYTYPSATAHYNLNYYVTDNAGNTVSSSDSISLPGPITISGRITHADGSPYPNITVYLYNAGATTGALTSAITDSNGAYTLTRAWLNDCYDVRPISGSTVFTPVKQTNICDNSSNVDIVGP